jgi:hypothetical protein
MHGLISGQYNFGIENIHVQPVREERIVTQSKKVFPKAKSIYQPKILKKKVSMGDMILRQRMKGR